MSDAKAFFLALFSLFIFAGCGEPRDKTALHDVHWDRDMCERCKMVTSDRHHAVQVINPKTGQSYMFDDIGCVTLWFEDEKILWQKEAKIWITDTKTGAWIDARTAYYDTNNITPMAYGFGAHANKTDIKTGEEVIRFDTLAPRIKKIEETNTANARNIQ